jgi:cell division protein FtsB
VLHYSIANKLEVQVKDLQEKVDELKAENKHLKKTVEQMSKQKDDVFFVKLETCQFASLG